jgi:AraC family transcriptional regulator
MLASAAVEWHRLGSRRRPPVPSERVLLSSGDRWKDLTLDLIDLMGPRVVPEVCLSEHLVVSHVDGPAPTDIWFAGRRVTGACLPDDVCIVPAQVPTALRRDAPGRIVMARIHPRLVAQAVRDEHQLHRQVRPTVCVRDQLLGELLRALTDEVLADNPGGSLYAETLGASIAVQLLRKHAGPLDTPKRREGLGTRELQRVVEYVEAHLAEPIHLLVLAELAEMSTYQLARRFKESMGLPPHRYVLRRRTERARELLRQPGASILEVALACGFSSQSHFATVFRALTGVSPRAFRDG